MLELVRRTHFFGLIFFVAASAIRAHATDYARFLQNPNFNVLQSEGQPRLFPGGHDEKYWAQTEDGRLYKLRLKNAVPNYAEIGTSILSEYAGLPTLAVYPVTIRRGQQGVPSVEAAKALSPDNRFMGLAGSRGEWFSATLQPTVVLQDFSSQGLNG